MTKTTLLQKKIVLPVIGVATVAAMLFGISQLANAQTEKTNPLSGLAHAIAQKFNINQNDLQSVINQYLKQRQTTMLQNVENRQKKRLDNLVKQGKITSAQEQAIIAEAAKLRNEYPLSSFTTMNQTQRKQTFQKERNELIDWAKSQGIDPKYVLPFGVIHRGFRYNHGSVTPSPTITPTATP